MISCFATISGSRVDSENGILLGVSVITEGEARGHKIQIDATTLQQVKASADTHKSGVQVKMNHGTGFESIVGVLRDFTIDGQQLRGDLHLLKSHDDYEKILEMAQAMPEAFGLSIAFSGIHETVDGVKFARCSELYSVDLVDHPAANPGGLFSAKVDNATTSKSMFEKIEQLTEKLLSRFSKVEETETKLSAALDEVNKYKSLLETSGGELSAAKTQVEELAQKLSAIEAAHKTELEAKESDVERRASAKALELSAKQGVPMGAVKPDSGKGGADSIPRAQFNSMSPEEKLSAIKRGAKITD